MLDMIKSLWADPDIRTALVTALYMIGGSALTFIIEKLSAKGGIWAKIGGAMKPVLLWLIGNRPTKPPVPPVA